MTERGGGVVAATRRAWARQRHHLARMARAVRRSGPGRLAGGVSSLEETFDDVTVTGWAGVPGRTLLGVLVTVDDHPVAAAELGVATPTDQFGRPFSARDPAAGWRATLPRRDLPPGPYRFSGIAVFDDGLTEPLLPLEWLLRDRELVAGWLDLPAGGDRLAAPVAPVTGWVRPDLGYDRIEVRLDGGPPQRARLLAIPRPEVAALVADPCAPLAGWQLLLDVPVVDSARQVRLEVTAHGPAGSADLGSRSVELVPPVPRPTPDPGRLAQLTARADAAGTRHRPRPEQVHLLVVTHHLGLGGGQLYLQELLRLLLAAEDVTCTVLAPQDGSLRDELETWGARVHIVGPIPPDGCGYEARMLELCELVGATGANVVLANTAGSYWGVDLAHRCGLGAVWAVHESFTLEQFVVAGFPGPIDDAVEGRLREAFATAEVVVFEADATRRLLQHHGDPDRFVRIDYGIDTDRITAYGAAHDRDEVRRQLGYGPDDVVLLCVGTFEPRKAQGALAVAFARAAAHHPEARLALVGDTGTPFAAAVHDVVDRLAAGDAIRIVPVIPDLDPWYLAADGFVLASDVESLPRSMLEAMAHGAPVLGSAVFGVPELIVDGDTGLLFEPECLDSLTAALRRFLDLPPAERRAIGERGRGAVVDHRASSHYADAYRDLLHALVADRSVLPRSVLALP